MKEVSATIKVRCRTESYQAVVYQLVEEGWTRPKTNAIINKNHCTFEMSRVITQGYVEVEFPAPYLIHWPGVGPQACCKEHTKKAKGFYRAMTDLELTVTDNFDPMLQCQNCINGTKIE